MRLRKYAAQFRQDHGIAGRFVEEESLAGFFEGAAVEVAQHQANGFPIGVLAFRQSSKKVLDADPRQGCAVVGGDSGFAQSEERV